MIRYEIKGHECFKPLGADEIAARFAAASLRREDPCRVVGALANHRRGFPLLKYDATAALSPPPLVPQAAAAELRASFGDSLRPVNAALKAGRICFGIGVAISWFFLLETSFSQLR